MTIEQKIAMALARENMSQADLAARLGTTRQNLNSRIKRNTLTKEDMERIAEIVGAKWVAEFRFDDGTVI